MARMLLLIRHAKAEQEGAGDAARELSGRGKSDARAAGRWLADNGFIPQYVVLSDAVRAQQTWDGIAATLGTTPAVTTDPRIYDNTVSALLEVVAEIPADVTSVAVVGHNPSMHSAALALNDGDGDRSARSRLGTSYPTMAIAVFEIEDEWSAVDKRSGRLLAFEAPRG